MKEFVFIAITAILVCACSISPNREYVVDEVTGSELDGYCYMELTGSPFSIYLPCSDAVSPHSKITLNIVVVSDDSENKQ